MKKKDLLKGLTERVEGLTQSKADEVLKALAEVVHEELAQGGEIVLPELVRLSVKTRLERKGKNPKTQEEIIIPEKKVPVIKATKSLKDAVEGK